MLRAIINLLTGRTAAVSAPQMQHPEIGVVEFNAAAGEWSTAGESEVSFVGLPGTAAGPDESAVASLVARQREVDRYWTMCESDLRFIAEGFDSIPKGLPIRELYRVTAFAWGAEEWEVCFQTLDRHKWIYVAMQFSGDELVSNSITT
ncbi:MAG TPA: hypothetical protein VJR92_09270 [Gemmatimonadaceae bacterium]|nr:hypothetical protein [Gemmatimonadaceae bacterium]